MKSVQNQLPVISPWQVLQTNSHMEPINFCRRWYAVEHLDAAALSDYESGRRSQYVRLLAIVLSVNDGTVKNWGTNFRRMPKIHQTTLGYADFIRRIIKAYHPSKDTEAVLAELTQRL